MAPESYELGLAGRALAALHFHDVVAKQTNYFFCSYHLRDQLNERFHDGVAGRQWSVSVVDVALKKYSRNRDSRVFQLDDVAACEALHRYASALLPEGCLAPLPGELIALKSQPGASWAPPIPEGDYNFYPFIDLRTYLRQLDEENAKLKARSMAGINHPETEAKGKLVTSQCVVTPRALQLLPVPIGTDNAETYGLEDTDYELDGRVDFPGGFLYDTSGAMPAGGWRGLGGGAAGAADVLEQTADTELIEVVPGLQRWSEKRPDDEDLVNGLDLCYARNAMLRAKAQEFRSLGAAAAGNPDDCGTAARSSEETPVVSSEEESVASSEGSALGLGALFRSASQALGLSATDDAAPSERSAEPAAASGHPDDSGCRLLPFSIGIGFVSARDVMEIDPNVVEEAPMILEGDPGEERPTPHRIMCVPRVELTIAPPGYDVEARGALDSHDGPVPHLWLARRV